MTNKPCHFLLLFLSFLLLQSCAMIPDPHEIPWFDQVYIHDNPRAGDFAVYTNKDQDYDLTWKVEKVNGNDIELSWRNDVHVMGVNLEYQTHMLVDRYGQVKKAWIRYDDGREINRPVAAKGTAGSKLNLQQLAVSDGFTINTPAGNFNIDDAYSYTANTDLGLASSNITNLDYLSPDTPFRLIKSYSIQGFTAGALLTMMQTVTLAGSASLTPNATRLFEKTLEESKDFDDEIVLIRYGKGP